jgi:hypothetical protein
MVSGVGEFGAVSSLSRCALAAVSSQPPSPTLQNAAVCVPDASKVAKRFAIEVTTKVRPPVASL